VSENFVLLDNTYVCGKNLVQSHIYQVKSRDFKNEGNYGVFGSLNFIICKVVAPIQ
jgi:hypothetical protein